MSYSIDWADLAFGSKKPINNLNATFIAAPRELSRKRFTQIIKEYLPAGNIVLGVAKEQYIAGFEGQSQFKTLDTATVQPIIDKVNDASPHKIHTLHYSQRETPFILDKLTFKKVLFVNGSWLHAFHTRSEFYTLTQKKTPYALISPFTDEDEAKAYEQEHILPALDHAGTYNAQQMLALAESAAKHSYDYMFQTGTSLGLKSGDTYSCVAVSYNAVVPYQTYAMHHGASREINFSPPQDLNHYDTVHAEVALVINAQKQQLSLHNTTLFINLLPCPSCSRMLSQTDIAEVVYQQDHSSGYAVKLLEAAGKKVTRLVP